MNRKHQSSHISHTMSHTLLQHNAQAFCQHRSSSKAAKAIYKAQYLQKIDWSRSSNPTAAQTQTAAGPPISQGNHQGNSTMALKEDSVLLLLLLHPESIPWALAYWQWNAVAATDPCYPSGRLGIDVAPCVVWILGMWPLTPLYL